MTRFVIDPPTLLQLAEVRDSVNQNHQLVAPNSIRSQTLDLILQRVRRGDLPEHAALELHERITEVKMRLLGDRVSRRMAWQIAREHDWSTLHDAEYLAVAKLQADALVTMNPELAAKAVGVVPLSSFADLFTD
jgi:predicted nucleic acid-binding protein